MAKCLWRLLFVGSLVSSLSWGSDSAGKFQIYTASSTKDDKPVALKLDTYTGDSWFFNGEYWQKMKETGAKNIYKQSGYVLSVVDSENGLVIFRFSTVNGSGWSYSDNGWMYIHNESPKKEDGSEDR